MRLEPDPAIFRLVCNRFELQPAEILFMDDAPSADIEGPQAIGMPAMLISEFEHTGQLQLSTGREGPSPSLKDLALGPWSAWKKVKRCWTKSWSMTI
jgi:FMN phosphatase YigB (HAD superfamily)